jgi:hypothetical protein
MNSTTFPNSITDYFNNARLESQRIQSTLAALFDDQKSGFLSNWFPFNELAEEGPRIQGSDHGCRLQTAETVACKDGCFILNIDHSDHVSFTDHAQSQNIELKEAGYMELRYSWKCFLATCKHVTP